ncbi:hypothetical protein DL93DRAFT_447409 [Clavulina sp. PMI_390]|nr:hypothetical protein DL93DRAFT_447409 [Clavulina sp. PMI_390]
MSAPLAHLQHHAHSLDDHSLSGRLPSAFDDEDDKIASSVNLNADRERRQNSGGSASMTGVGASRDAADFAQNGGVRTVFARSRPRNLGPGGGTSHSDVGAAPFDNIGLPGGRASGGHVLPRLQTQFGPGKLAHGASPLSASAVGGRFLYRASSAADECEPQHG